jgi:shikimate dehydrogenase
MVTGRTQVLGIMGFPVEHSLSPMMHNAAIAHLGVDGIYVPFAVDPQDLKTAIAGLAASGIQGLSVTIPHKQTVMPLLTEISPQAQAIGAVNTLYRTAMGWGGTNTDVTGFVAPLRAYDRDWQHCSVLVLGNGGAARAVVAGCADLGCSRIQVVGRSANRLDTFLTGWSPDWAAKINGFLWDKLPHLLPDADLIVNTTPVGMAPHAAASPLTAAEIRDITPGAIVYDLIYTPSPTQLLQAAQAQGAIAIDGLEMLVQQGAAALELWLQQPAPVDVMRQALKQALGL